MDAYQKKYSVVVGNSGYEIADTDSLDEANQIMDKYNDQLTSDEWDKDEFAWIFNNETGLYE